MNDNQKKVVRTVLGDVHPFEIGLTYSHEHIIIEESFPTISNPLFLLNDVEKISRELLQFYLAGGRTVVDTMPANCGRNVEKLAEVSRRSGVHIIAPTGMHLEKYYMPGHWRYSYTEDQLSQLFIDDILTGIDKYDYSGPVTERTPYKAGVIKLATGDGLITPHQEKIFRAVVNAHIETGAPVLTHTNAGQLALEQVELFEKLGANPEHVVISHVDRRNDVEYHRALLQRGVRLEYDSAFRWKPAEINVTLELLGKLLPEFPDQITLGMDMAKNSYWKSYGGSPGMNYLIEDYTERMKQRGLAEYLERIFISTPSRLFEFF